MTANDQELLGQFIREQSQDAFTALVNRHLNLVYAAAFRQVRSPQLAEEVCQTVFVDLACHATKLKPGTLLSAWLYQVTRRAAIDVVRREARRQAREQIAMEMKSTSDTSTDWAQIEPFLDEAMHSLGDAERTALLLRYFENKRLREVGEAMGTSEDAAQKRVLRGLEHLREFFAKRQVTVGTGSLAALLSVNAAQGAPAGLAAALSASAVTAATALTTSTAATITQTIAMTTLQKTIIIIVAAGGLVTGVYQARQNSKLRQEVQTLKAEQRQEAALSNEVQALRLERDRATNAVAKLSTEIAALKKAPSDTLRLRGEVGRLRRENTEIGSTSPLSKVTANPDAVKMMRAQQKIGMGYIYKAFAQQANLTTEQTDKLNDLLADHIMDNVGNVTTMLRDKASAEKINEVFASQDAVLESKLRETLGEDAVAKYQEYTRDILGMLSAEQFKGMLSGNDQEKEAKAKQLRQAIQEAAQAALSSAGLPVDYQTVPILNFRNIASEQEAERSLKLLDDIYKQAAARSGSFLTAEDLTKFEEFRSKAIDNSRGALTMNRSLMAPIAQ
jgi:RNA polymerase sigma factor (sigma-70 family)